MRSIEDNLYWTNRLHRDIELYGKTPPDVHPDELATWVLFEDDDILVVNKPGWLVCHPSKRGPLSSLVGAARVHTKCERLHLVARLDRETSGVVVLAKHSVAARKYQMAVQRRQVHKIYIAVLNGELDSPRRVEKPIGKCVDSLVHSKMQVRTVGEGKSAATSFSPIDCHDGYTLCKVETETGRRHQIRVHAQWLGHSIVGDKIYGPDEKLFVEFITNGWTDLHASSLPIKRHALHCHQYRFEFPEDAQQFVALVPSDIAALIAGKVGIQQLPV